MALIIMGVCGAGKSTVGELLGRVMECDFLDADDFFTEDKKEKMREGIALDDDDRYPWLELLRATLQRYIEENKRVIMGCSSLRRKYREKLRCADPFYIEGSCCGRGGEGGVRFVMLEAPEQVLASRLEKRMAEGVHFMPTTLLGSQLEALEIDEDEAIFKVDATLKPHHIVDIIKASLFTSTATTGVSIFS